MAKRVINMKISDEQHNQLKTLSDKYGFTMTGYVQHLILNEWNKLSQFDQLSELKQMLERDDLKKLLRVYNNNNKIR